MRPPKGFEAEKFPLRHNLAFAFNLSLGSESKNTAVLPLVVSTKDTDTLPNLIQTNPHNSAYDEDGGPVVHQMSIIDRMTISLKFSMTHFCQIAHVSSGLSGSEVYTGDDIPIFKFLWRPIFNVYPEKLDAADDQTGTTVASILGLTKDATNEDVVPVTTNKLATAGPSELVMPTSTVVRADAITDYNMTTNFAMEDHVFDEALLQKALRRYTNKGALRSCLGMTRHVTLTRNKPFKNFYIDKFVPRAIRRVQPYSFFGIQVHVPFMSDIDQQYQTSDSSGSGAGHLGVKCIVNYHEWNSEHDQERGTPA